MGRTRERGYFFFAAFRFFAAFFAGFLAFFAFLLAFLVATEVLLREWYSKRRDLIRKTSSRNAIFFFHDR